MKNQNPALAQLIGDLHAHSTLTSSGLDSEQASEVVFHRLRAEDARHHVEMRSSVSKCCRADVGYFQTQHAFCSECGESCEVVPNHN